MTGSDQEAKIRQIDKTNKHAIHLGLASHDNMRLSLARYDIREFNIRNNLHLKMHRNTTILNQESDIL